MVTADTISALCAAIDQGDDSALPILADALEEMGDPRSGGLRTNFVRHRKPWRKPHAPEQGYWWMVWSVGHPTYDCTITVAVGSRMGAESAYSYPSRSAAFLALAEAQDAEQI